MATQLDEAGLLLPVGTRLVHIGPQKTGTTSLQAAFHAARSSLTAQGVHYAGRTRHSRRASLAVIGRPAPFETEPPPIRKWLDLAREVRESSHARVFFSSESLASAEPDTVRRIVDDLGGPRVHVAVTVRPSARILPSKWQQWVQRGGRLSLDRWLRAELGAGAGKGKSGPRTHRLDLLVARWAEVVGVDNLTVVVVDEKDHGFVLRTFERLLGLRDGTLVLGRPQNRSLTLAEVESLRALNIAFHERDLSSSIYATVVREAIARMKEREPAPGEQRITLPSWAVDATATHARQIIDSIRASGVRIVGNLDSLAVVPESRYDEAVSVPPEIAAELAMNILVQATAAREDVRRGPRAIVRRLRRRAVTALTAARTSTG